jgi:hypothetical protein
MKSGDHRLIVIVVTKSKKLKTEDGHWGQEEATKQ